MATLFSDDFNRADNTSLGANWTELNGDSQILSNRLRFATSTSGAVRVNTTVSAHAATADVKVTVTQVSSSGDGGPCARDSGDNDTAPTMYAVDVYTGTCEIYRHDNSLSGTLLRTASITQVANGVIALEVSGTGATVTLKQYYQGSQRGADATDSTANRITSANRTGAYNWVSATDGDYEDFLVEDLVAGAARRWFLGAH